MAREYQARVTQTGTNPRFQNPSTPTYMQPAGGQSSMMGMMFGPPPDPVTTGPGKSLKTQHLGSVVGRRGAGISTITGGDPGAHAVNHYGKSGIAGIEGGGS